jgi:hypothetical protein
MLTETQLRLQIGDAAFDALPDARRPARAPRKPVQRRSRIEARQRLVLGGSVPAIVAAGFTTAEVAVLCVLASEHKRHGRCELTVGEIARLAQCCRTVVQNCLYWAERRGLLEVQRRRVARDRNAPNVVRIVSRTWIAWLRLGPSRPRPWGGAGEGSFRHPQTPYKCQKDGFPASERGGRGAQPGSRRAWSGPRSP